MINTEGYVETTKEQLKNLANARVVSVDYESVNANIHDPNNRVLSVAFSNEEGLSYVEVSTDGTLSKEATDIIEDPNIAKIVASRPFEENVTKKLLSTEMRGNIYDVITMAHCINENNHIYSLQDVVKWTTGQDGLKDLAEGQRCNLANVEKDLIIRYNGGDSDYTLRAYNAMKKKYQQDGKLANYYKNYMIPVQKAFGEMCLNGAYVDKDRLRANELEAHDICKNLESDCLAMVPDNIISKYLVKKMKGSLIDKPGLLRDFLFNHEEGLNLKPVPFYITEKTRVPQTTEDHLKNFVEHPFVEKLLEYKKVNKLYTTYLTTLWDHIQPDGKIYPQVLFNRTVTGRTVMLDPPIQTFPSRGKYARLVKEIIVAPEGYTLCSRDLAQSELRIIGWLAQDKNILKALREDIDLHKLTAARVYGCTVEEVTKAQRQGAKAVNFGYIYGMQAKKFQKYAKDEYGVDFTLEQAQEARKQYFAKPDGFYGLEDYYSAIKEEIYTTGQLRGVLGRVRNLPEVFDTSEDAWKIRGRAERQAINTKVQTFSSELGALGYTIFHNEVKQYGDDVITMPFFIHDSSVFLAKEDKADDYLLFMKDCMESKTKAYIAQYFGVDVDYPILSDAKRGPNWSEMHDA